MLSVYFRPVYCIALCCTTVVLRFPLSFASRRFWRRGCRLLSCFDSISSWPWPRGGLSDAWLIVGFLWSFRICLVLLRLGYRSLVRVCSSLCSFWRWGECFKSGPLATSLFLFDKLIYFGIGSHLFAYFASSLIALRYYARSIFGLFHRRLTSLLNRLVLSHFWFPPWERIRRSLDFWPMHPRQIWEPSLRFAW